MKPCAQMHAMLLTSIFFGCGSARSPVSEKGGEGYREKFWFSIGPWSNIGRGAAVTGLSWFENTIV